MLLKDILLEKRKHPKQQKVYLEDYLNHLPSLDGIYLHYTNVDKVGIYPSTDWRETPIGIYAYSAKHSYHLANGKVKVKWKPNHSNYTKWVFVLKANPDMKLFDFGDYSVEQFNRDRKALNLSMEELYPFSNPDEVYKGEPYRMAYRLYNYVFSRQKDRTLSKFRKKLGYSGVHDPGFGFIHKNEKRQTVFFSRKSFTVLKQLRDYKNASQSFKRKSIPLPVNHQQIIDRLRRGEWQAFKLLGDDEKISLSPDLQLELIKLSNTPFRGLDRENWTKAIKAVKNPTDEFLLALIDMGYDALVKKYHHKLSDVVKSYLLKKNYTNIIDMVNPPPDAKEIIKKQLIKRNMFKNEQELDTLMSLAK